MKSSSLSEMRDDARVLADQPTLTTTSRVTTALGTKWVNEGVCEAFDILIGVNGYAFYGKPWLTIGSVTPAGTTPPTVAFAGSPVEASQIVLDVVTGGTLTVATVRYSRDAGVTWSSTVASAATLRLAGTGVIATMAAGTYSANNTYSADTARPQTVSGQVYYALPADFYKLHQVALARATEILRLDRLQQFDEAALRSGSASGSGAPSFYAERGTGYETMLGVWPPPAAGYELDVLYVPRAPTLTAEDDFFDGINGWETYPVAYAARKMAIKDEEYELVAKLEQEMARLKARMQGRGKDRDAGTPRQVQDVYSRRPAGVFPLRRAWRGMR